MDCLLGKRLKDYQGFRIYKNRADWLVDEPIIYEVTYWNGDHMGFYYSLEDAKKWIRRMNRIYREMKSIVKNRPDCERMGK